MNIRREKFNKRREIETFGTRVLPDVMLFFIGILTVSVKTFIVYESNRSPSVFGDIIGNLIFVVMTGYFLIIGFSSTASERMPRKDSVLEYLSAGFGGTLLITVAIFVITDGINGIRRPGTEFEQTNPLLILLSANLPLLASAMILTFLGKRKPSNHMTSEGKRTLQVVWMSMAILFGLFLSHFLRLPAIDGLVALITGLYLLMKGLQLALLPFRGFKDVSEPDFLNSIFRILNEYRKEAWIDIHKLEAGFRNRAIDISLHLILPKDFSLEQANEEAIFIRKILMEKFKRNTRIMVHSESCIETDCPYCSRENCSFRGSTPPLQETPWTLSSLTSEKGPGQRLHAGKSWEAKPELMTRIIEVADNNSRLMNWIVDILDIPGLDFDAIFRRMEIVEAKFRVKVFVDELLKQQSTGLKKVLESMLTFRLPIPKKMIDAVAFHIPGFNDHLDRAVLLGLIEVRREKSERIYRLRPAVTTLLREKVPELSEKKARTAVLTLYDIWWRDQEAVPETKGLEILRLALAGREKSIAVEITNRFSKQCILKHQYQDTIDICIRTMKMVGEDYRLLRNMAQAENALGQLENALGNYKLALKKCPNEENRERASLLHNMAVIYTKMGYFVKALTLFQHAMEIKESTGSNETKATTMSWIAVIYAKQGKLGEALKLHRQVMDIQDSVSDTRGKAATLNHMANIHLKLEDKQKALELFTEAYEIIREHGNSQDRSATLNFLAETCASMEKYKEALAYYQQLREAQRETGDVKSMRETVAKMSKLSIRMLNNMKPPELKRVK